MRGRLLMGRTLIQVGHRYFEPCNLQTIKILATNNWYANQDFNASETVQTNIPQLPWNSMNTGQSMESSTRAAHEIYCPDIPNATAAKQSAGRSNSFCEEGIVNQKSEFNQATGAGTSINSGAAAMMINTRQPGQGQR